VGNDRVPHCSVAAVRSCAVRAHHNGVRFVGTETPGLSADRFLARGSPGAKELTSENALLPDLPDFVLASVLLPVHQGQRLATILATTVAIASTAGARITDRAEPFDSVVDCRVGDPTQALRSLLVAPGCALVEQPPEVSQDGIADQRVKPTPPESTYLRSPIASAISTASEISVADASAPVCSRPDCAAHPAIWHESSPSHEGWVQVVGRTRDDREVVSLTKEPRPLPVG
jgi:hypothetical protein